MRTALAFLWIAAAAMAQEKPPAPARAVPARPAVPSYTDLKYPPLHPIAIPKVETSTLPNGMRLYLLEDHELPLVNGTALVRTGNLFDPKDKIGLATLTGTVLRTGGTRTRTGDELDVQLENIAAGVESGIGESSGTVSFSALKANTEEVLAVFKEVLTAPEFRQDKLDLAKSQMRSGISRRNDDASGVAQREFADLIYGKDTPYGWSEEYATIDAIQRADLQAFYGRFFFPANVMLAVSGDFDTAEMKARIEKLFADWTVKQPPVPDFPKVGPEPAGGTYLAVKQEVTQTFFGIGQRGGEYRDKDYAALVIMGDILGGGFQSRLFQRVRTKMGNAYDIDASWGAQYDHPGVFEISGSTRSLSTVETIKAIREEVDRIRTAEVTEEELKTAKSTALNSLVFAYDTRAKTLNRMLVYEYYGYPRDFIQQYQKALAAVTRADVLRVAKERLNPAKFAVVAVGNPQDFGTKLDVLGSPPIPIDLTIAPPRAAAPAPAAVTAPVPAAAAPATVPATDAGGRERGRQLLSRMQQAVGGAEKLAGVKDLVRVSEYRVPSPSGGMLVKLTERWIAPGVFRQEGETGPQKIVAYWDGKTGWLSSPQGFGALTGTPLKQIQGDVFRLYFPLLLADRVEGRTLHAIDADTLEVSDPKSGQTARVVIDSATGLPSKVLQTEPGGAVSLEEDYADFRDVDGIKVPHKITILNAGRKFADVTVSEIRLNTGLKVQDLIRRP